MHKFKIALWRAAIAYKARPLLLFCPVLFLGMMPQSEAATYTALSPALSDVQAAVNQATNGDTVIVPAGSATWITPLTYSVDITLQGAGTNATFITDEVPRTNGEAQVILAYPNQSGSEFRITGFTFYGGVTNTTTAYDGLVRLIGDCFLMRVDHCAFVNMNGAALNFQGWQYGVADHNYFIANFKESILVWPYDWGGPTNNYGDGSWADDERLGSTNVICIEDSYFEDTADTEPAANALDTYYGGRVVFRHNTCKNTAPTTHGTETSGRARGFRTLEVYLNHFIAYPNGSSGGSFRGGTGLVYSNTYDGGYWSGIPLLTDYRLSQAFKYWGAADGANPWDSNSPTIYDSGTATSADNGANTMTDTSKSWKVNQWVNYSLVNTDTVNGAIITANTVNTLTILPDNGNGGHVTFSAGSNYQIRYMHVALDQVGRGKGQLLYGVPPTNMATGMASYPMQALEPCYAWSNTINGILTGFSGNWRLVQNQDYYNDVIPPGYTPLVYPHPLVTGSTNTNTQPETVSPPTALQAFSPSNPPPTGQSSTQPSTGSTNGNCAAYTTSAGANIDNQATYTSLSQSWRDSANQTICSITITIATAYSRTSHCEIRTAPNGGGSLIADSTSSKTVAGQTVYIFSPPVAITAGTTIYIYEVPEQNYDRLPLTKYTTSGHVYQGASPYADGNYDLIFVLNTLQ